TCIRPATVGLRGRGRVRERPIRRYRHQPGPGIGRPRVRLEGGKVTEGGMRMVAMPSAGVSITGRGSGPAGGNAIGRIATAVGDAGAIVTALDVVDSDHVTVIADVTCDTANMAHAEQVVEALRNIDGLEVRKVSDRTFLLHLGGKIEVHPKVS